MKPISLRNKVQGMLLGVGIGDGLGYATESMTPEQIALAYPIGRITKFIPATARRWYKGEPAGTTSDDTQLTLAVLDAIIAARGLEINSQVTTHVKALNESTAGWGSSTRKAIEALSEGTSVTKSGVSGPKLGKGNACAMKISPLAAFLVGGLKGNFRDSIEGGLSSTSFMRTVFSFASQLSLMTHNTLMAVESAFVHITGLSYCLNPFCDYGHGNDFDPHILLQLVQGAFPFALDSVKKRAVDMEGNFPAQMGKVFYHEDYDIARLRAEFGGCSCYIEHSLPATYIVFLNNPFSIDSLYDIIMAGGDTDTNGSMLGSLLGALNGPQVFPQHLIEGLVGKDRILAAADQFCNLVGIP